MYKPIDSFSELNLYVKGTKVPSISIL